MRRPGVGVLALVCLAFFSATDSRALANRVFVSARSGNDANACDNINTPCQTFAGAVTQLNPGGEAIVLDSGGYGPVTITQAVTIEAAPGVTAFIHPPSGDAITVNAGSGKVTLRGLVLNGGTGAGINVNSAGTLNVENCTITGFGGGAGIAMFSAGHLNVKGTDITSCQSGVFALNPGGTILASIDHCHLDGNMTGYVTETTSPGVSLTTGSYSTANNNSNNGWVVGGSSSGVDALYLEFCTGSENGLYGLAEASTNAQSKAGYSNCQFANNGQYGVARFGSSTVESRGDNTIRNNAAGSTTGSITPFSPM